MKQILKALSFALIALWMITSSVAVSASVSDTSKLSSKSMHGSSEMMMVGCTMQHEPMTHFSLPFDADVCGEHASYADCKMLGADHCSNVFAKFMVSDHKLAAVSAMKIQMQDYRRVLTGISLEALTPPPRS